MCRLRVPERLKVAWKGDDMNSSAHASLSLGHEQNVLKLGNAISAGREADRVVVRWLSFMRSN